MSSVISLKSAVTRAASDPGGSHRVVNPELQRVWFALSQRSWASLAIVPSDGSVQVHRFAERLCVAAQQEGSRTVRLVDTRGTAFPQFQQVSATLSVTSPTNCALVVVDDVADNPTALAVARATSAVLIAVRFGASRLATTRKLIETLGRDRIVGCVVVAED